MTHLYDYTVRAAAIYMTASARQLTLQQNLTVLVLLQRPPALTAEIEYTSLMCQRYTSTETGSMISKNPLNETGEVQSCLSSATALLQIFYYCIVGTTCRLVARSVKVLEGVDLFPNKS